MLTSRRKTLTYTDPAVTAKALLPRKITQLVPRLLKLHSDLRNGDAITPREILEVIQDMEAVQDCLFIAFLSGFRKDPA